MAATGGSGSSAWFDIQRLALSGDEGNDAMIQLKVLEAQRQSVKLPFVRKVIKDNVAITVNGKATTVGTGQTIICDIVSSPSLSSSLGS